MKKTLKLIFAAVLLTAVILSSAACTLISGVLDGISGQSESEEEFYYLVSDTKVLLDDLADDIYQNWYDSIYNDKFENDIDKAIDAAFNDHEDDIETILANTDTINTLYKDIKNGSLADEAKAVMQAYNEYYSFVIEVSGSFNDYSDSKEDIKKELATALKNYASEY